MRQNSSSVYQSSIALLLLACIVVFGGGCATLGWYGQAARGQLELLVKREDIEKRIEAPETSPGQRAKLELVLDARQFAHQRLALPDNGSYTRFVELDRDAVVYNVIATPALSLEPKTWCYPLVGCLSYRGYFRRAGAERAARRLAGDGLDVRVAPVPAYSTLGHFADPVTSPMLDFGDARLAGLIFHELAHQQVFVRGETAFNEAYATAVERAGVEAFLQARGRTPALRAWRADRLLAAAFNRMLLEFRERLERVYAGDQDAAARLAAKQRCFAALKARYRRFRERHEDGRYDAWMARDLNNADLALVATYEAGVTAFSDLLAEYDGDFARFHAAVERLAESGAEARAQFLDRSRTRNQP